jgi:hypothetical protein|tara:strand:+ start:78 stop:686 length:609 start_codon:yes stop_codon:yes gene_type:complete
MASKRRLETVQPWRTNAEGLAARTTDENYRVYKYEDGTQLAGLFREFPDGKLHMDAGSRINPTGNTTELQYWQESRSRYVGAGGVQLNAKICSDIALWRVAEGQAAVITGTQRFPDESDADEDESEPEHDAETDEAILLCDACDAEHLLSATGLTCVPDGEWYCDACAKQERRLKRLKRLKDGNLIPDDVYKDRIRELVNAM